MCESGLTLVCTYWIVSGELVVIDSVVQLGFECGVKNAISSCCISLCFFFKQKTAYEMLRSRVGAEMCIRDRYGTAD